MPKGIYHIPKAVNEPIKNYASKSPERIELQAMLKELRSKEVDIPMYIGNKEVRSENKIRLAPPLVITESQIQDCLSIIEKALNDFK